MYNQSGLESPNGTLARDSDFILLDRRGRDLHRDYSFPYGGETCTGITPSPMRARLALGALLPLREGETRIGIIPSPVGGETPGRDPSFPLSGGVPHRNSRL